MGQAYMCPLNYVQVWAKVMWFWRKEDLLSDDIIKLTDKQEESLYLDPLTSLAWYDMFLLQESQHNWCM